MQRRMNCLDATLLYQLDETRALLASLGSLSRITAKAIFTSIKRVCLGESPLKLYGGTPNVVEKGRAVLSARLRSPEHNCRGLSRMRKSLRRQDVCLTPEDC